MIACDTAGVGVHRVDAVGRQHLQRAAQRGLRQRVRVDADEQRAVDALRRAVVADRLRDRQHVALVERAVERVAAMARGAERHALRRLRRIGQVRVVRADELGDVDQRRARCRLAGEGGDVLGHSSGFAQAVRRWR
jgi:hypothetical protein